MDLCVQRMLVVLAELACSSTHLSCGCNAQTRKPLVDMAVRWVCEGLLPADYNVFDDDFFVRRPQNHVAVRPVFHLIENMTEYIIASGFFPDLLRLKGRHQNH